MTPCLQHLLKEQLIQTLQCVSVMTLRPVGGFGHAWMCVYIGVYVCVVSTQGSWQLIDRTPALQHLAQISRRSWNLELHRPSAHLPAAQKPHAVVFNHKSTAKIPTGRIKIRGKQRASFFSSIFLFFCSCFLQIHTTSSSLGDPPKPAGSLEEFRSFLTAGKQLHWETRSGK